MNNNINNNNQKFIAEKIRSEYIQKESPELDALRTLDAKVKRPANMFAGIFGTVSALVMGSGMSLAMTDIGQTLNLSNPMTTGIVIGLIGIVMASLTYPVYKKILTGRKNKYAAEIMKLSEKIVDKQ